MKRSTAILTLLLACAAHADAPAVARLLEGGRCECDNWKHENCTWPAGCTELCHSPILMPLGHDNLYTCAKVGPQKAPPERREQAADQEQKLRDAFTSKKALSPPTPLDRNQQKLKKLAAAFESPKPEFRQREDDRLRCIHEMRACQHGCSALENRCWETKCEAAYDAATRYQSTPWSRDMARFRRTLCEGSCRPTGCYEGCPNCDRKWHPGHTNSKVRAE